MPKGTGIQLNDSVSSSGEICDLKILVKRDAENKIISGLVIGNVTEQNKALMLIMQPGESKEQPTTGVGIENALMDDDLLGLRHSIRRNFTKDGLNITKLDLYDLNKVQIAAKY